MGTSSGEFLRHHEVRFWLPGADALTGRVEMLNPRWTDRKLCWSPGRQCVQPIRALDISLEAGCVDGVQLAKPDHCHAHRFKNRSRDFFLFLALSLHDGHR